MITHALPVRTDETIQPSRSVVIFYCERHPSGPIVSINGIRYPVEPLSPSQLVESIYKKAFSGLKT